MTNQFFKRLSKRSQLGIELVPPDFLQLCRATTESEPNQRTLERGHRRRKSKKLEGGFFEDEARVLLAPPELELSLVLEQVDLHHRGPVGDDPCPEEADVRVNTLPKTKKQSPMFVCLIA